MTKNKTYALAIDRIQSAVEDFKISNKTIQVTTKETKRGLLISISLNGNKGNLHCYYTKGLVSFYIDGNESIEDICRDCQEKIISLTRLPFQNVACVTISNVEFENFNSFIDLIKEEKGISVSERNKQNLNNIKCCYEIKGSYHAHVILTYYKNKTLYLQGIFNMFFVWIRNEIIDLLTVIPSNIVDDFLSQEKIENKVVETDLDKLFPKVVKNTLKDSILETFIITSAKLLNQSYPKLPDYGFITFNILKAIDGLLRIKMGEGMSSFGRFYMFHYDNHTKTYKFKEEILRYNDRPTLKRALEHGYTFFHKHRNTTFHVDNRDIETSRRLSFEDAKGIFKDSINIITEICNN